MKKCASCTKDLPDAALHCVFCGAKQPPAPAVASSAAKTVMGHSSNEVIEAIKAQQVAAAARQAPSNLPAAAPYSAPPVAAPPVHRPNPVGAMPGSPPVPAAASVAATMFVPGGGPPGAMPGHGGPPMGGPPMGGPPMGGPPMGGPPMGGPMGGGPPMGGAPMPAPMPAPTPGPGGIMPGQIAPVPSSAPTYQTPRTSARPGRPIEPWKDTLRLMMFIWGGVLIAAFMTPTATEPDLAFMFNTIIDAEGTAKLGPLLIVAIGLLSIVLAAIPTSPSPRGLIAGLLGLCGLFIPLLLGMSKGELGLGQILTLVGYVGMLLLIPGLLLRSEYRDSIMPRILVTVGALCVLVPLLIPQNDSMPLVETFKAIIDAEGKGKISAIIDLGPPLIAVLSLLAWLPAPTSGGAKVFAWLLIVWPAVDQLSGLLLDGNIGDVVAGSPYAALMAWAPLSAYYVLTGFGFATVFGKQLE